MKKVISIFAIIFIAATAFVAPAATAAPTSQELKGTWIGTYGGFEGNQKANGGQEKIVITSVYQGVAKGYWQSRHVGEKWSKKSTLHLINYRNEDGESYISGTDSSGTYNGIISADGEFVIAYTQTTGRYLNLQIVVRKK
jgi:hypothetical protein